MKHHLFWTIAALTLAGTTVVAGPAEALAATHTAPSAISGLGKIHVLQTAAQVEGVTRQVLIQDLRNGETLLQIANGKYASAGDLAVALLAPAKARFDAAVTSGKITAAQESLAYGKLLTSMTTLVTTPHPLQAIRQSEGPKIRSLINQSLGSVATACTTTPSALKAAMQAGGSSILAICKQTNPQQTQTTLTAVIFAPMQAKLQAAVQQNLITSAQEALLSNRAQTAIGKAITRTIPVRPAKA